MLAFALAIVIAGAKPASADEAAAKALFDQGKALFAEGKYGEACTRLEASFQLAKLSSTRGLLGACYEKIGKLASAWNAYRESAGIAERQGHAERAAAARESAALLEPRLAKLAIDATAVQNVKGIDVMIDGIVQPGPALNQPLPIDSGPHVISADGRGWKKWETTIDIVDGEQQKAQVPALAPAPKELEPAAGPPWSTRKKLGFGIALGGGGLVAIAIAFGTVAKIKWEGSECTQTTCPSQPAKDKADTAAFYANIATIVGGAGLVVGGVGLTIMFTDKPAAETPAAAAPAAPKPTGVVLVVEGRF
jgi:hypothetical protein